MRQPPPALGCCDPPPPPPRKHPASVLKNQQVNTYHVGKLLMFIVRIIRTDKLYGLESFFRSYCSLNWSRKFLHLWNRIVHNHVQNNPSLISNLSQINSVHTLVYYIFNKYFNITLPSTAGYSE
jgi:hypothetical protein